MTDDRNQPREELSDVSTSLLNIAEWIARNLFLLRRNFWSIWNLFTLDPSIQMKNTLTNARLRKKTHQHCCPRDQQNNDESFKNDARSCAENDEFPPLWPNSESILKKMSFFRPCIHWQNTTLPQWAWNKIRQREVWSSSKSKDLMAAQREKKSFLASGLKTQWSEVDRSDSVKRKRKLNLTNLCGAAAEGTSLLIAHYGGTHDLPPKLVSHDLRWGLEPNRSSDGHHCDIFCHKEVLTKSKQNTAGIARSLPMQKWTCVKALTICWTKHSKVHQNNNLSLKRKKTKSLQGGHRNSCDPRLANFDLSTVRPFESLQYFGCIQMICHK